MLKAFLNRQGRRFMDVLVDKAMYQLSHYELHPHTLMLRQAQQEAAEYAQTHMQGAMVFASPRDILRYALRKATLKGLILEFGVAEGVSIRSMAEAVAGPVHGFDSFEGLPEDWPGRHEPQGAYSTAGRLPKVPGNVVLHKGWFDQTLPAFLQAQAGVASFVHVDCDLYSSTKTVLTLLADRLVPGTVLLFDEYFNYVSWRDHEFKAFQEFVRERHVTYQYLAWAYQQAAVLITGVGTRSRSVGEQLALEPVP